MTALTRAADLFDLTDRVAMITGGAGHLAGVYAAVLAGAGARLALVDVDADRAVRRASELAAGGVDAVGIGADVSDERAVARCVAAIEERFGRLDVVVNNAALALTHADTRLEHFAAADWTREIEIDLTGMFLVIKHAAPVLRRSGGGSIINVASIYGIVSPDPRIYEGSDLSTPPVYPAAKGGVVALTRYVAAYLAKDGIRCNSLTPGGVFASQPEEFVRRYSERVPLGRMARADELAGAILYLASGASSYVTGHNLVVDGGLTAW